jgi:hypothetical protein
LLNAAQQPFGELGPIKDPKLRQGEQNMNDQNRVLIRKGARELSPEEVEQVIGGFAQTNVITFGPTGRDGDGLLDS